LPTKNHKNKRIIQTCQAKGLAVFLITGIFLFSCSEKQKEQERANTFAPKVVEANGYVVPKDSMRVPLVIPVDESKLTKIAVGNPLVVPTNTNVHPAGIPKIVIAGIPRVIVPGQDTFLLPKKVMAIDSPFVAGIPEITLAKEPAVKDQNPENFSSFSKLQGLKSGNILCILEDKSGNLWFGATGGVVCKYDGKSFTHFTDKEALSNNAVWSMLEDKSGNLWFGTGGGGVCKYDGKSFTHFTDKEGLSNNDVRSMLEDKSGNLWFGANGGVVCKYDGKSFTHFTDKEGLSNNNVSSMLEDKSGNLWFGTKGGGVCKYDGKSFTHFTDKEGLSNNDVRSMLEDKSGNLWFSTYGGGVCKYDGKSFTHFTDKEGLSNNVVWSMLEDKSGNLWFSTYGGGVCKYDGKSFTHFTDKEGLANNTVLSMLEDKSGNLWFGTNGGGVCKYAGKSFTHFTDKEALSNNAVWSMLEDKSGNLWFGTIGGGVCKYDGKSFTHFTDKEGLSNNFVLSILEDKSGNLWFGTNGGSVCKYDGKSFTHFTDKEGLSNNGVWSMLEDKSGNLWFGTKGRGVSKYDGNRVEAIEAALQRGEIVPERIQQDLKKINGKLVKSFTHFTEKEGLSNNTVCSILEDKSGNLWFGTKGGGVSKYDGKSFTHFTDKEGLSNNDVRSILEDKSGNLWFGGGGGGVCKYDGKSFTHFTDKEGLANNTVLSMLEDKSGNLWFGTNGGLSKLTLNKLVEINEKVKTNSIKEEDIFFKDYTYSDGFLGIGVNAGNTMLQAKDGTIWIGASDRLTAMHPENMLPDTIAPNIQLTTIELFNENIAWANLENKKDSTLTLGNGVSVSNFSFDGLTKWYSIPQNLSLAYNNNYLTFNFIGITMNQPKNVKYQYILEGIDENWSAITNKTSAPYGNLPHGTYSFKVKAMNSEGYWSKAFEYKFTIRPPFWQTWWFRTLIGLLIISSIWYYIKSREKKLVAEKEKLEKTVEERTEELVHKNIVVEQQKHLVEEKSEKLGEALKDITDSINYALRIQQAFLPNKKEINLSLPQSFILFKPKDIVSGDFYFFHKNKESVFIAAVDCTGHGVPGAFMSMVGSERLTDAVQQSNDTSAILSLLNKGVKTSLKQSSKDESTRDGMDIAICSVDTKNRIVKYAGANRPIWIIRKGQTEVEEIKATKVAIGGLTNDDQHFDTHEIKLQQGDTFYICTDGYADQFSGKDGKKLMTRKLKAILVSIQNKTMPEQEQYLDNFVEDWKAGTEQVDDILVIGIRV